MKNCRLVSFNLSCSFYLDDGAVMFAHVSAIEVGFVICQCANVQLLLKKVKVVTNFTLFCTKRKCFIQTRFRVVLLTQNGKLFVAFLLGL